MDAEIARHVYPIFSHGLSVRDRLEAGEFLDLDVEQATLKRMLATLPLRNLRCALVCWLDEVLGRLGSWGPAAWEDRTLEMALHGTSDGSWRFWDQARQAETRPACDALEVYYLCVMLGFRGELAEEPDRLRDWVESVRRRIEAGGVIDWLQPPEAEPVTHVPPLRAWERLQRRVLLAGMAFLVLIPAAAFILIRQLVW